MYLRVEKAPGRSLARVDVRVLDASRFEEQECSQWRVMTRRVEVFFLFEE